MSDSIEHRRLRVYVAGPMSHGDVFDNMVRGIKAGRQMVADGLAPYIPHLDLFLMGASYIDTNTHTLQWNSALEWDLEWVASSEAVYRLEGPSKGADLEVERAIEHGIPVFFEDTNQYDDLMQYARNRNLTGVRV